MEYLLAILAVLAAAIVFAYRKVRYWRFEQFVAIPQTPASMVWGHLKALGEELARLPKMIHPDYAFLNLLEKAGNPPVLLLDFRPVSYALCIIRDQGVAEQISRASKAYPYSQPKSPTMIEMKPLIGSHSIITAQSEKWKSLRRQFNAGFAPQHLITLLPQVLDKTRAFMAVLDDLARSGAEFQLNKLTTNLTFDIIGSIVMDVDLYAQTDQKDVVVTSFSTLLESYSDTGFKWLILSPSEWWTRRKATREMGRAVRALVRENFAKAKQAQREGKRSAKGRSVLALSLQDLNELDERTTDVVAHQIQSFLFAGHDTTASVLAWAFYDLSRYPKAAARLRAELDEVLGPDASPDAVTARLRDGGEDVMRRLSFTSAVIKETLRLHPPASSARMPAPAGGFVVDLPDGQELNLEGVVCYIMHYALQRDPNVYGPTADEFRPERWLETGDVSTVSEDYANESPRSDSEKKIPAGAWRPFERGPRNCIGQELANLETRVILACAARRYDFEKIGAGALLRDTKGNYVLEEGMDRYRAQSEVYNMRQVTSKPFDGMQMRVKFHST